MKRRLIPLVVLVSAVPSPAAATNYGNATYSPSYIGSTSRFQSSWRTPNDSQSFYINAKWDSTHRAGVQAWVSQGYRYSQDFRDQSDYSFLYRNLNATGRFATTFENPIFDTDDDDGDWKEEEAEITAKSTAFPSVNQNYYAEAQFSHWYYQCGGGCQFLWDPDGGRVDYRSQISYWLVAEYESHRSSGIYRRVTYPYQAPPSGAASSPDEAGAPVPTHEGTVADVQGIQVLLEPDARDLDVRAISTPQLQDLVRANAKRTAILMGEEGPYRAIVTFAVPLSPVAFEDLIDDVKMSISSFEAIGPADGGQIMTIGGDLALLDVLPKWFADRGAVLDGVVAADVLLEGAADLQRLASSPSIFLIDVAPEVLARQLGDELPSRLESYRDRFDILVNDVYWQQAGIGGS